jgi:signal transduction histidine kinase
LHRFEVMARPEGRQERHVHFRTKLFAGFAAIIIVLALGMAFAIHRIRAVSRVQVARLQEVTQEIAVAERLRWAGELIVSTGRGYLVADGSQLHGEIDTATATFARDLEALRATVPSAESRRLAAAAEATAARFIAVQQQLVAAKQAGAPRAELEDRFLSELTPLREELGDALDALVHNEDAEMRRDYDVAHARRAALEAELYTMLAVLVIASLGLALAFANQATRAYRDERDAKDSAREALAARDQVMGIVAHDLRNPLAAITMKASVLQGTAPTAELRERAGSIENVTMRMEYLIRTMLDVVHAESGSFVLAATACAVRPILDESAALFGDLAEVKHVTLTTDAPVNLMIRADHDRVVQVLSVLVGNALRLTPQGGRVALAVRAEDEHARFDVTDTGPGIAPEDVPHVFERFWTGTTPGYKGMGLGLYISKHLVEAQGGRIWVESERSGGTTFSFTLPLA